MLLHRLRRVACIIFPLVIAIAVAAPGPRSLSIPRLAKLFQNPPAEYRDKPFWAWNGKLNDDEVKRQVHIFHEMGFGGFFMHSRTGLQTGYLGADWFRLVNTAADAAAQEGMEAWLYDEDRWPSGFAGGAVTRDPQYRMKFLSLATQPISQFQWREGIVAAYACTLNGTAVSGCVRLTDNTNTKAMRDKTALTFTVEEMDSSSAYNGYTYADTLNREATDEFIRATHEQYRQHSADRFGHAIKGIFSDEPQRGPVFNGFSIGNANRRQMVPWTGLLRSAFNRRFGYDICDRLPELFFYPEGQPVAQVKWQYMELLQSMFLQNWEEPIQAWCQRNHLLFTGHALHEDSLTAQAAPQGSLMRYYEHEDYPGVDVLSESNRNYWLAKQASSVSHQLAKPRTLSELYGATGWQFDFAGHKEVGDWQEIFGINFRVPHLAWYTMAGEAKRDYPASIFFQSAWWRDYKYVEDYYARMNLLLTQGHPIRDVLVVNPVESVWAQVGVGWAEGLTPKLKSIQNLEKAYQSVFTQLTAAQIDFDYGDEEMLGRLSKITRSHAGALLQVGEATYRVAVVPPMTTIRSSTLQLLKRFREAGGTVIFAGAAPEYMDVKRSSQPAELAAQARRVSLEDGSLAGAVNAVRPNPVEIRQPGSVPQEQIFSELREDNSRLILAALSTDRKQTFSKVLMRVRATGQVEEWNCRDGRRYQLPAKAQNGWLSWTADFVPLEEHVYIVTKAADVLPRQPHYTKIAETPINGPFDYKLDEPNVLLLDLARYRLNGSGWSSVMEVLKVDRDVRQKVGLPLRAGDMLQPWARLQKEAKPTSKGKLNLQFTFDVRTLPAHPVQLAIEQPENFAIRLNNTSIASKGANGWWVDPALRTLNLPAGSLKLGHNMLEISTDFREDVDLESLYLLGEFGVQLHGWQPEIISLPAQLKPDDLVAQGLPFYSGKVTYHVPLPPQHVMSRQLFLETPGFSAACLKVGMPGHKPEIIAWQPYSAALTAGAKTKTIDIEAVLTRRNTFGPMHLVPKEANAYGPESFRSEGKHWSQNYQLYPGGLTMPPVLASYKVD